MFLYVIALLPSLAIAALAHELTHVVAARAVGAESAQIKWFRRRESWVSLTLIVDYDFGRPVGDWRHRIVGLSPLLCGLAIAVGVLIVNGVPSFSPGMIVLAASWAMYTVTGGLEDYRV